MKILLMLCLFCGVGQCATMAQAVLKDRVMPIWIQGEEHLLPPVAPEVVVQMRKDWDVLQSADFEDRRVKPSREFIEAAHRVVQLGETASLALIWLYVQETRYDNGEVTVLKNQSNRLRIARICRCDPEFGKWIFPVVRAEMGFLEREADWRSSTAMVTISVIMDSRGEDDDLERFVDLVNVYHASLPERIRPPHYTLQEALSTRQQNRAEVLKLAKTTADKYQEILKHFDEASEMKVPQFRTLQGQEVMPQGVEKNTTQSAEAKVSLIEIGPAQGRFGWWPWAGAGLVLTLLVWIALRCRK